MAQIGVCPISHGWPWQVFSDEKMQKAKHLISVIFPKCLRRSKISKAPTYMAQLCNGSAVAKLLAME